MKEQIERLNERLERKQKRLQQLQSGRLYFGTMDPRGSPPTWKDGTKEAIEELKADIAVIESVVREFGGRS